MKKVLSVLLIFTLLLLSSCASSESTTNKSDKKDKQDKTEQTGQEDTKNGLGDFLSGIGTLFGGSNEATENVIEGVTDMEDPETEDVPDTEVSLSDFVDPSIIVKLKKLYDEEESLLYKLESLGDDNDLFERKFVCDKLISTASEEITVAESILASLENAQSDADPLVKDQISAYYDEIFTFLSGAQQNYEQYVTRLGVIIETICSDVYVSEDFLTSFAFDEFDEQLSYFISELEPKSTDSHPPSSVFPSVGEQFMWPLSVGYISSYFGNRYIGKREDFHCGIDIACATGTPVYAANSGVVVESSYHQTYGYYVVVFHGPDANGDSYATLYGHLSTANVATGTVVSKGDVIGEVGSSGISLGSHLHFGFFLNGTALDPKNYIVQN